MGTTAVVVLLIGCRLCAASVGDSRAVLGWRTGDDGNGASTVAVDALTWDHNPYRADELERVKRAGGVVMNYEEMAAYGSQGAVTTPSWQTQLQHKPGPASGAPVFSLDPPRVWDRGLTKPGCCFTRSLGDSFAKTLGVISEPEVTCRDLVGEFVLCVGSDGVFEFLSNEDLLSLAAAHRDRPLHTCRTVCGRTALLSPPPGKQESRADRERRELLFHHRDDTTIICVHISTQKKQQPS